MARIKVIVHTTTHGRVEVENAFDEVVGTPNVAEAVERIGQIVKDAHADEVNR